MQTYGNQKNPLVRSRAGLAATMLQAELLGFGVELRGQETHYDLTRLITRYGKDAVKAVAMKALDRYTGGVDGTQGKTAEEYILARLESHIWNRNNHK